MKTIFSKISQVFIRKWLTDKPVIKINAKGARTYCLWNSLVILHQCKFINCVRVVKPQILWTGLTLWIEDCGSWIEKINLIRKFEGSCQPFCVKRNLVTRNNIKKWRNIKCVCFRRELFNKNFTLFILLIFVLLEIGSFEKSYL